MILCRLMAGVCLLIVLGGGILSAQEETTPNEAADNNALLAELNELRKRLHHMVDLQADFIQEKHTVLLRRPIVSNGRVRMAGELMRWDTLKPAPSSLLISPGQIKLYYPQQNLLEIYPVDQQLVRLASSPVPRMEVMREHFTLSRIVIGQWSEFTDSEGYLAVAMKPLDEKLGEHVELIRLLIDRRTGYLKVMELLDADGERTVTRFLEVQINTGQNAEQLALNPPEGVRISRPLSPE